MVHGCSDFPYETWLTNERQEIPSRLVDEANTLSRIQMFKLFQSQHVYA
jgi:hypothetical protein